MLRFTIRDVLWLTVVVAMALGWMIHSRAIDTNWRTQVEYIQQRLSKCQRELFNCQKYGK